MEEIKTLLQKCDKGFTKQAKIFEQLLLYFKDKDTVNYQSIICRNLEEIKKIRKEIGKHIK